MPTVHEWAEISGNYRNTLLLGNGASIAVDPCFRYDSLLQAARGSGNITDAVQKIFKYLDTQDFELVLNMLWHAHHINRALETPEDNTIAAYLDIRQALISAVRAHHTDYDTARPHLEAMWKYMANFRTVVSLNYDLIVYWAMMAANQELGNWFKDGFVAQVFEENWRKLREPYKAAGSTLVVYPHGNLVIATRLADAEAKIVRHGDANLLDDILASWEGGAASPLFVSEGGTKQKLAAIFRSNYLSRVFQDVLSSVGPSVAVYGWAAKMNDSHITRRLIDAGVQRFAFSVRTADKSGTDIEKECVALEDRVCAFGSHVRVEFYRSESAGCWVSV